MDRHERLGNALRGLAVDRPPVWFMRQAGRYLPSYRELRARHAFVEMIRDADLCCEATVQPVDRFPLDAAIIFSDILVALEAVGCPVAYESGRGPAITRPLRDPADVPRLRPTAEAPALLGVAHEAIRRFRAARPAVPVLGFCGAPWTLFCYLVEGGGSDDWVHPKRFAASHPEATAALLDRLADVVGDHLQAQVEAGAAAVQIFDTWAGTLDNEGFRRWALPAAQRALARVRGAPRIWFCRDTAPFLPWVRETGADVIGLDWRTDMATARAALGEVPVQGNLDPVALFGPVDEIRRKVGAICDAAGSTGHVFNLGHGVLPGTPVEGVEAMVRAVVERAG